MVVFLRDPWIEKSINEQLHGWMGPMSVRQRMSFNAQMIDVYGKRSDGSINVCISDARRFIAAVLSCEAVAEFGKDVACSIEDVRGCYMTVDVFWYEYCSKRKMFVAFVQEFTYCGGECDVWGEPTDMNGSEQLRSIGMSWMYATFRADELYIHRAAVHGCDEIAKMLDSGDDYCGEQCERCWRFAEGKRPGMEGNTGCALGNSKAYAGTEQADKMHVDVEYADIHVKSRNDIALEKCFIDICSDSDDALDAACIIQSQQSRSCP
ncbi:hypothetical protein HK407_12g18040 [Ordospora pajunii]|uniref:uncharacterized protein n=1 Tax=Ordospora pajunii TaxID=3039483 RepID=UPI002952806C|nr:uncharacterized protein HK407_12g18040 [Ordospora pajunii]KAH9410672.1 hypothetical protein HK407_12g18040 [Ordospora pajunii]